MTEIELRPLFHRGMERIAMVFPADPKLNQELQKIKEVKWSRTHRCWYGPMEESFYQSVARVLKPYAHIQTDRLREYLERRKKKNRKEKKDPDAGDAGYSEPGHLMPVPVKLSQGERRHAPIHPVNAHVEGRMRQQLVLKSYSASTIRTYMNEMGIFLRTIRANAADEFTPGRIRDYLEYCATTLQLSENTLHSRMNSLKFYYEQVLGRDRFFWEIPRPRKAKQLPPIFSKEEVIRLLRAITNLKHRAMVMLAYGCGLRVSEVTKLELRDIDVNRRVVFVRRAKGKKDRIVSLSPVILVVLREYVEKFRPKRYLFEGAGVGKPYSIRSLESVVQDAKRRAGIRKPGSVHSLRHSYATHLIDKGTDVVFIQQLLGHNDIKTTLQYLHVTNKNLLQILSPLDDIKDFLLGNG